MFKKIVFALLAASIVAAHHHAGFQHDDSWRPESEESVSQNFENQQTHFAQNKQHGRHGHWASVEQKHGQQADFAEQDYKLPYAQQQFQQRLQGMTYSGEQEQQQQQQPERGQGVFTMAQKVYDNLKAQGRKLHILASEEEENRSNPINILQSNPIAHHDSHENTGKGRQVDNEQNSRWKMSRETY